MRYRPTRPLELASPCGNSLDLDIGSRRGVSAPLAVEVDGAGDAPAPVHLNLADVGAGADLAAAGPFGEGNVDGQGAGLGPHLATEVHAEATVEAAGPVAVGLGQDRHRRRKGVQPELAGGPVEQHARGLHRQRRQRVRLRARWIEGVGAGQAGDAQFFLGLGVVRLQVGVGRSDAPRIAHRHCHQATVSNLTPGGFRTSWLATYIRWQYNGCGERRHRIRLGRRERTALEAAPRDTR